MIRKVLNQATGSIRVYAEGSPARLLQACITLYSARTARVPKPCTELTENLHSRCEANERGRPGAHTLKNEN